MTWSYSEANARGKARGLLKRGWYEDLSEIDVVVLAWEASDNTLELEFDGLDSASQGRIVVGPTGGVIRIKPNLSRRRQRFVLAHELGHYVLHRERSTGFIDSSKTLAEFSDNHIETEANWFASELLLPGDLFQHHIRDAKPIMGNVRQWSDQFDVPRLSTLMQFITYSPECCAIVYSYQGQPQWFRKSKLWERSHFYIKMNDELPKGSHSRGVFYGKEYAGAPQRITAGAWLENFRWEDSAMIWEDVWYWDNLDILISLLWIEDDI